VLIALITALETGTDGECDAVKVFGVLTGTYHDFESPMSRHRNLPLSSIGAWRTGRTEVERILAHIHLHHTGDDKRRHGPWELWWRLSAYLGCAGRGRVVT
jgi:hypothetical protein